MSISLKNIASSLLNKLWQFLAIIVIVFAILISIARLSMPYLENHKTEVENWLSQRSGSIVKIQGLKGEWKALGPALYIKNLSITSTEKQDIIFQAESLELSLDLLKSLVSWQWVTDTFLMQNSHWYLNQKPDGTIYIKGLEKTKEEPLQSNKIIDIFLQQNQLQIINSKLYIERANKTILDFDITELTLNRYYQTKSSASNNQSIRNINVYQATGTLLNQQGGKLNLVLEFSKKGLFENNNLRLYLTSSDLPLQQLPIETLNPKLEHIKGKLSLKLWLDLKAGKWDSALLQIHMKDFSLHPESHHSLDQLSADIRLRKDSTQWFINSHNIILTVDEETLAPANLFAEVQQLQDDQFQFNGRIQHLSLGHTLQLLETTALLDDKTIEHIHSFHPHANSFHIEAQGQFGNKQLSKLHSRLLFKHLSYSSKPPIPNIQGLSGELEITQDAGRFFLTGEKLELDFHKLFRNPISAEELSANGRWFNKNDNLNIEITAFTLNNSDLSLQAQMAAQIPTQGSTPLSPQLSLYGEVLNADIKNKSRYFPSGIMEQNLVDYLDESIITGKMLIAKIALRGPLSAFPFENPEGTFAVYGKVEDTLFDYFPEWPKIHNLTADLWFIGDRMEIQLQKGSVQELTLKKGVATIPRLSKNAKLQVKASVKSKGKSAIQFINQSPLKKNVGQYLQGLNISGPLSTSIDLRVPLDDGAETSVAGYVDFNRARLYEASSKLTVNDLKGRLYFSDDDIYSEKINAQLLGGPAKLTLQQRIDSSKHTYTWVGVDGTFTASGLADYLDLDLQDQITGQSPYQGEVNIFNQIPSARTEISISSDLKGISINAPSPLYKTAEEEKPLRFNMALSNSNIDTQLDYGQQVKIALKSSGEFTQQEIQQTAISVYSKKSALAKPTPDKTISPDTNTIRTNHPSQDSFNVEQWSNFLNQLLAKETGQKSDLFHYHLLQKPLTLNFLEINLYGYLFQNFTLDIIPEKHSKTLKIFANDTQGQIVIRSDNGIDIQFKKLKLLPIQQDEKEKSQYQLLTKNIPSIRFSSEEFEYDGKQLGHLSFTTQATTSGLKISGLINRPQYLYSPFQINWSDDKTVSTYLAAQFESPDIGELLRDWNLKADLQESNIKAKLELSWPDALNRWQLAKTDGSIKIEIGKGHIKEVSDMKARVFSLLSLQSLRRRLALDFSDLYQDGFFYDSIEGKFTLNQGVAHTDKVYINGTAAEVEINGIVDLNQKHIDQHIIVSPKLSSSLPVLAGWAVEPSTGLLVLLLNELFKPALKVITAVEYQVVGELENPEVLEIKKTEGTVELPEEELEQLQSAKKVPKTEQQ